MTEHPLDRLFSRHWEGQGVGVTSICTANPTVLETSIAHGAAGEHLVLIEATCNQVNQDGGYTGMTASDFMGSVIEMADRAGLPRERLVLGGDHLGPNPWRHLPADEAMDKAETLVRSFVGAGYTKIHLDCSMRCADDPRGALDPEVIAARATRLASAAEEEGSARYVIGTEVPIPGGEVAGHEGISVTRTEDVASTIEVHRDSFLSAGLEDAWSRVVAVVVQPGVEFSDTELHEYDAGKAAHLRDFIGTQGGLVFEAHSTDYQTRDALTELVRDHFAILKVGPGLTFAYREAVFALSMVEDELLGEAASDLRAVVDGVMVDHPDYWEPYYRGDEEALRFARRYSMSDRSRYYWPDPQIQSALKVLYTNLESIEIPLPLLSQFMPDEYRKIREAALEPNPRALVSARIEAVLDDYVVATG